MHHSRLITTIALLLASQATMAVTQTESHPIAFPAGKERTYFTGTVAGSRHIDYTLSAKAGQLLSVTLFSDNDDNYFDLLLPYSEEPLFIGSTSGHQLNTQLPVNGDYKVRLYLCDHGTDPTEHAHYQLSVYQPRR